MSIFRNTARQLTKHHYQQLFPATERLDVIVTLVFHNNAIKNPFGKRFNELAENVFAIIHNIRFSKSDTLQFQIDTL